MRSPIFTKAAAVILTLLPWASAAGTTIIASADTYITVHPVLGGPNSNHGADSFLSEIGPNTFQTYPLVRELSG